MARINASQEARTAFYRARFKAFARRAVSSLRREPNQLLAYDEVRKQVRAGMPIYKGVQAVPLKQVIGSVNRYRDFDRAFLPTQSHTGARWRNIGRAYYADISLPPVELYKVGDVYFVVDGNHRVSVAREMGQEFIDAIVRESRVRVPVTPDLDARDLEVVGEKTRFLEATHLDESRPDVDIQLTIPGGYDLLLEHIEVHRYLQSTEWEREFTTEEAAAQWLDQVYVPLVNVIRETGVLSEFPQRTEADLYLWIIEHQYYLHEQYGGEVSPWAAAQSFAYRFTARPLHRLWNFIETHILRRSSR